jgi:large repetitive protein
MQIKFQQYDQYPAASGGRAWDDISITTDAGADQYLIEVLEGDPLTMVTTTPGDGTGEPVNTLVPRIELFAPDGTSVGSNSGGAADGHNALLEHEAAVSGTYRVLVTAVSGAGAYTMRIDGATGTQAFRVLSSDPADGERFAAFPATFRVDLSEGVLLTSLEASDLQITLPDSTVLPADAVTLLDARTLEFAIASAAADDGLYQVALAAGSLTAVSGASLEAFEAAFEFDTTGPIVVDTSILDGGTMNSGLLTWIVTFNEPLATEGLGPEDVTLAGGGDTWHPDTFDYDPATDTLTVTFDYVSKATIRSPWPAGRPSSATW